LSRTPANAHSSKIACDTMLSFFILMIFAGWMQLGQADNGEAPSSAKRAFFSGANITDMLTNLSKTASQSTPVSGEMWSNFLGGSGGEAGDRKVCPKGSYISEFVVQEGNKAHGHSGISKIGQVTCSDGTQLACCDGVGRYGDKIVILDTKYGADRARVASDNLVRGICLGIECAGHGGRSRNVVCSLGSVIAGFQAFRGVLVDSIRFLCRGQFNCGTRMYEIDSRACPYSYKLLPCGQAPMNTLCLGDANCGTRMDLNNCERHSIYLKL